MEIPWNPIFKNISCILKLSLNRLLGSKYNFHFGLDYILDYDRSEAYRVLYENIVYGVTSEQVISNAF